MAITIPQPELGHDKIYVIWKIGDQSEKGARDFELICYIDPDEWTMDGQPVISDHMASVYGIAVISKDYKEIVKEKITSNNEYADNNSTIRWCLDKTNFTSATLESLYAKGEVVPIFDGEVYGADETWLVEKDFTGLDLVEDRNAITSGSYTIGSGGDYTTCNLFEADLDTLTNNISGVYISDVTETVDTIFNSDYGPYTLRLTSNDLNNLVTFATNIEFTISPTVSGGGIEIDSFKILGGSGRCIQCVSLTSATDISIHDLSIDYNYSTGYAIYIYNALADVKLFNNKIYNGSSSRLLYVRNASTNSIIENNTIDGRNSSYGITCANLVIIVRNNVVFGCDAGDFLQIATTVGYNNACSDASGEDTDFGGGGEGNLTNINPYHEFLSLDPTSPYFLKPRPGQQIARYGTRPTLSTTDIATSARPHTAP